MRIYNAVTQAFQQDYQRGNLGYLPRERSCPNDCRSRGYHALCTHCGRPITAISDQFAVDLAQARSQGADVEFALNKCPVLARDFLPVTVHHADDRIAQCLTVTFSDQILSVPW